MLMQYHVQLIFLQNSYGGRAGCDFGLLYCPNSLRLDEEGCILVAERNNSRITLLDGDLNHLKVLACNKKLLATTIIEQKYTTTPLGLNHPYRMCLNDETGLLFVGQRKEGVLVYKARNATKNRYIHVCFY